MFHPDHRRAAWERAMAADGLTTIPSSYGPKANDEPARGRGEGKGHDGICPYRSCRRGERGWVIAAADRGLDLWQCQSRHAAHAIGSNNRARPAAEGAGLAGHLGQDMALLQ